MTRKNDFRKNLERGLVILVLGLFAGGCGNSALESLTEDQKSVQSSEITPPQPLFDSVQMIPLTFPRLGAIQYVFETDGKLLLRFQDQSEHQMVWILSERPTQESLADGRFLEHCVAGSASFLRPTWDGVLTATKDPRTTEWMRCGSTLQEPLNPKVPVPLCLQGSKDCEQGLEIDRTYYWLVLGYDSHFRLKAASSVGQFVLR